MKGIYSQRCWINEKLQPATIYFDKEKVVEIFIGALGDRDGAIEDFGTAVIMPGAMDVHVHINEPGRTEWEGFETATKAAAGCRRGDDARRYAVEF